MKTLATLWSILCVHAAVFGQTETKSLTGTISDENGKAASFASALLFKMPDSLLEKSAVCDSLGQFELSVLSTGTFVLVIDFPGCMRHSSEAILIDSSFTSKSFTIKLLPETKTLDEVTITDLKRFIRMEAGKIIVDPDQSAITSTGTAMDVLKRSPGISVDQNDNITLKGKQSILILIDDKPTYMTRDQLMNMLRNMPASQIDVIELINNPPAKYDASGNAGVINIKLKKMKRIGYNGSLSAGGGYGWYEKMNWSGQFNLRTQKFNLFAGYDANKSISGSKNNLTRKMPNGNSTTDFDQMFETKNSGFYNGIKLGTDFYLNSKTTLGFMVNGTINPDLGDTKNETSISGSNDLGFTHLIANNKTDESLKKFNSNINFSHTFDSLGKKLSLDLDYSTYESHNDGQFINRYLDANDVEVFAPTDLKNNNQSSATIWAGKIDYYHPTKKGMVIEGGLKSSYVTTDNNIFFELLQNGVYIPDSSRNNDFTYVENINAAYVSASKRYTKWGFNAGLRTEHTNNQGISHTLDSTVTRQYINLFPSLSLDWTLDSSNNLTLSYSRRIDRPSYMDLNPFVYYADQYTFMKGNPFLKPQFTHGISLSHSFMYVVFTTIGADITTDNISGIIEQDTATNVAYYTSINFDKYNNYYINLYTGFPIKNYMFQLSFTGFYNEYISQTTGGDIDNGQFTYNIYSSHSLSFGKGKQKTWTAEISGWYMSPALYGVFKMRPMKSIDVGLKKKFPKINLTANLSFTDVFKLLGSNMTIDDNGMNQQFSNTWESRKLMLKLTWNFGKARIRNEKRSTAAEDEQKRLNGGGGGMGGGMPGGK
ncbi:MAG: outer membrane beta-barrel protein [Flavobacteriales bacterium]